MADPQKLERVQPKQAKQEPHPAAEEVVDDTGDDSFPASDPPAWTTTAQRSVAARRCAEGDPNCDEAETGVKQPPASSRAPAG
jgi:hypothetical protein